MAHFLTVRTIGWAVLAGVALGGTGGCSRTAAFTQIDLSDGTSVYYRGGTTVTVADGYPTPRRIKVDGEAYLTVAARAAPLTVSTRLMTLTVTGEAALRVSAFSSQTGEQADVVRGAVVANKNYPSKYLVPYNLAKGDLVMVNQTIDLMEKERSDAKPLQAWVAGILAEARAP